MSVGSDLHYDLNRHWQVRLDVGQPGFIARCRACLAILAMLCIAGWQAAAILALLFIAGRRRRQKAGHPGPLQLEIDANGLCRLFHPPLQTAEQHGSIRNLQSYWQGPYWFTLVLRNPYLPHHPPDIVTVWSFGQAPDVWRRFRVLLRAAHWAGASSTAGRVAI